MPHQAKRAVIRALASFYSLAHRDLLRRDQDCIRVREELLR